MAIKERKAVETYLVCDVCDQDITMATFATKVVGEATGYMKRDKLEVDLCESCASKLGLHRRGRPAIKEPIAAAAAAATTAEATPLAPIKRGPGRPRKNPLPESPLPTPVKLIPADDDWTDDDWEGEEQNKN